MAFDFTTSFSYSRPDFAQVKIDQESLPSLEYSDGSCEDYDFRKTSIAMSAESDNIHDVLDDVLVNMARVVEHLRDHGRNEAANRVSRDITTTFRYLYDTLTSFSKNDCAMKRPNAHRFSDIPSADTPQQLPKSSECGSWAAIAATAPDDGNRLIKYRPCDALKQNMVEQEMAQAETNPHDRRVIWIQPWREDRPLRIITDSMKQFGAIYSMAYAPKERSVCIIFQHAHSAMQFMHDHADFIGRTGTGKFGLGIAVLPGNPYPLNDDLRRMDNPYNERRRLTFARQQLFSHGLTEHQFKADLEAVVGPANVELVWLFNTGNATVVFSAVPLARLARDRFEEMSRQPGSPYERVMVSFSHDPCERDLHLITQIPKFSSTSSQNGGSSPNRQSGKSRRPSSSSATSAVRRQGATKSFIDSDGWQTVGKKR